MRRLPMSSWLAGALVAASLGIGGWKVTEVRRENARLALQARTCMAKNEAFLSMLRTAAERRRANASEEASVQGKREP